MKGYYFITDASLSKAGNLSDVENALAAGVSVVQYRNKKGTTLELFEEAKLLRKICRSALFLINDRIDIAFAVDADGVHIGQDDMPIEVARNILGDKKIIGITVHTVEEAKKAQEGGADYVGLSPVFATSTKDDAGSPCGVEMIKKLKKSVDIPVVAIGGINSKNAEEVVSAGADALCAISDVVTSENVKERIKKIQALFERER
ncbi:MAG: thiamine phosphate synthase [Elusimicrobia bacterium]|nr:thiamine phosphate synthase [Elusimicrobiota bacterium]